MNNKNELITLDEAEPILGDSKTDMATVKLLLDYLDDTEELEYRLVAHKEDVRMLHQRMDRLSKSLAKLKALIEAAMFTAFGSPLGSELETEFKFQAGRKTTAALSNGPLATIAIGNGVTPEEFASACRPLTAKAFGEMLGYTEAAVLANYGELFDVQRSKPVLKRVYDL